MIEGKKKKKKKIFIVKRKEEKKIKMEKILNCQSFFSFRDEKGEKKWKIKKGNKHWNDIYKEQKMLSYTVWPIM